MFKNLFKRFFLLVAASATAVSTLAADPVTFTRYSYDGKGGMFQTYEADVPFAALYEEYENSTPTEKSYKFTLLTKNVEPVRTFSIPIPEDYDVEYLHFLGEDHYIQGFLVTQHFFNDDDLYEVVIGKYNPNTGNSNYIIYNEKGESLGELPDIILLKLDDTIFIYEEYEVYDSVVQTSYVMANLYTVNKGGSSVSNLKANDSRFNISPNPAKGDELVTVTLPEAATHDMIVKVYSLDGKMMVQRECKQGMNSVVIPASMLSTGINPVVAFDAEGNITFSGKIVRE